MNTTNTNDTEACVAQAKRIIEAGGELVRLTTQGSREAENMKFTSTLTWLMWLPYIARRCA